MKMTTSLKRTRSPAESSPEKKTKIQNEFQRRETLLQPPRRQHALLLHTARQPYDLATSHETPEIKLADELLIKVEAIGLNPIDWKAP